MVGSGFASADVAAPGETHWQCVQQYDELFNIACIPDPAFAASAPVARAGLVKAALPVTGNERAAAGDDSGNPVISNVRTVPLYIQPSDTAMVSELLQMVLCDASEHCKIRYLSK